MTRSTKRIRKAKYLLFKHRIHRVLPAASFNFAGHLSGLSQWIAAHRDLEYSTFPQREFKYVERYGLYQHVIDRHVGDAPIDYLEFGVSRGESFRWWVEHVPHEAARFYGFDTFSGLPEDWGPFKKGAMSNGNKPPEIPGSRHQFFEGIFQQTLHDFLSTYRVERRKVVHLDADLYSSTLFVLTTLSPYLRKGDVLLFDEFNVPMHEYKAFQEWSAAFYIEYRVIGEVNNYYQVAMQLV